MPVENSTEGAVGRTMDLLLVAAQEICGEVVLRIHQNLLSNETDFSQITKVYSHAQSLAQCHEWLNRMLPRPADFGRQQLAQAAQMAAEEAGDGGDRRRSGGCPLQLPKLVENIEDEPNNTTRFLVLGKHDAGPRTRQDFADHVGAQPHRRAARVAAAAVRRPACRCAAWSPSGPQRLVGYVFYVDIEGHRDEPAIKAGAWKNWLLPMLAVI